MAPPATARYDWILALTTITFFFSAFGNGANDVANAYATSVAARTLSMLQVGFLATITEFVGAVALGSRVTDTIKNGISELQRHTRGAILLEARLAYNPENSADLGGQSPSTASRAARAFSCLPWVVPRWATPSG